jgi:NADPH:quinone reductase
MKNTALHGLQLLSELSDNGQHDVTLIEQTLALPAADEVVIQVQATPLNPSDMGLLWGAADLSQVQADAQGRHTCAPTSAAALTVLAGRLNQAMPVGNEGAGVVVQAGESAAAQALLGKTVAVLAGGMYAQYRLVKAAQCLVLPEGTSAAQGASCFVNPLTALGFVETMRHEGHKALVHTAAASNLGQMLNKICMADGVELVNIVRKPEQAALLRGLGARHVCDSSAPDFAQQLTQALIETGATLAFDATGGGTLASQILACMEAALGRNATSYSRYGTTTHKQVYLYGGLDTSPTVIQRTFGMSWGVGGWLVFPYLEKLSAEIQAGLRQRVLRELHTTFASHYSQEISLSDVLKPAVIAAYNAKATASKYLVNPSLG